MGKTMEELVNVRREGCVAVLTLSVPERRNVLSSALVSAIGDTFAALERDDTVRCVVITGEGRAFCAGAELTTLEAAARGEFSPVQEVYEGFLSVLRSPLVTIAAVNGPAVGAGFNLALACDVRLAGTRALFDTRFSALQIHPGGGHAWLLTRAVGQQQAMLACLFGEVWKADAALARGLVASVHPEEELIEQAVALGRRLEGQESAFTRRLVATLRDSVSTVHHSDALAAETVAQQWSTTRPGFLDAVQEIQRRIGTSGT
jgi:enoyl-CoA hydratase